MATSPVLPKLVGQRIKRREDPRLIQGRATYVDDVKIAGMQHIAFKRSDVAHGRIRSIDTSAAQAMEGVEAVFTGAQIAELVPPMPIATAFPSPVHRAVAADVVRYAGEPVASRGQRPVWAQMPPTRLSSSATCCRQSSIGARDRHAGGRPRLPQQSCRGARTERHRRQPGRHGGRHGDQQGIRRCRGGHLAADGESPARPQRHRAARRGRALRAGKRVDDDLVVHAEPAHPADHDRGGQRARTGSGARHRAGGRRRLRREDQHLRRGTWGCHPEAAR